MNIYDEIEIEDFTFDAELEIYHYPCPCGDRFEISLNDLKEGETIAYCPSCSLMIRVIYDQDKFVENDEELCSQPTSRYGATAASVYLVISIIDFGFSWGAVKSLGSTAIGFYEKILLEIEHRTGWQLKHSMTSLETNKKSMENESPNIWTQIAIAYGIHKLLILVRVPLTAAFTPPLVKILNQKGWSIGRLKK
ncbi:hypothetical protein PCANB_001923 [Pneumocystis canis]|nr:hypothetical protein PCANB_001923 [Pneumocystis canis]